MTAVTAMFHMTMTLVAHMTMVFVTHLIMVLMVHLLMVHLVTMVHLLMVLMVAMVHLIMILVVHLVVIAMAHLTMALVVHPLMVLGNLRSLCPLPGIRPVILSVEKKSCGLDKSGTHIFGCANVNTDAGPWHLFPETVHYFCEIGPGLTTHREHVRICSGPRPTPTTARHLLFKRSEER